MFDLGTKSTIDMDCGLARGNPQFPRIVGLSCPIHNSAPKWSDTAYCVLHSLNSLEVVDLELKNISQEPMHNSIFILWLSQTAEHINLMKCRYITSSAISLLSKTSLLRFSMNDFGVSQKFDRWIQF